MEKLLTPDDVATILQVSKRTAYTIMHQMPHMERPCRVSELGLRSWIDKQTRTVGEPKKRRTEQRMPMMADFHIPRKRVAE